MTTLERQIQILASIDNDLKNANSLFGFAMGLANNTVLHQEFFKEFVYNLLGEPTKNMQTLITKYPKAFIYLSLLKAYGQEKHITLSDFLKDTFQYNKQYYISELEKYLEDESENKAQSLQNNHKWKEYFDSLKSEGYHLDDLKQRLSKNQDLIQSNNSKTVSKLLYDCFLKSNKELRVLAEQFTEGDNVLLKSLSSLEVLHSLSNNFDFIAVSQIKDANQWDKIKLFLMSVINNVKILYQDRPNGNEIQQISMIQAKIETITKNDIKTLIEAKKAFKETVVELQKFSPDLNKLKNSTQNLIYALGSYAEKKTDQNTIQIVEVLKIFAIEFDTVKDLTGFKKVWDNIKEFFKSFTVLQGWIGKDRLTRLQEAMAVQQCTWITTIDTQQEGTSILPITYGFNGTYYVIN